MEIPNKIVFYDGDCGLCNRSVAYVLKNEKHSEVHFAAIQSEFTMELFSKRGWEKPNLSTVYYLEEERLYVKSSAALNICLNLKFPQISLYTFIIVPRFIRDFVYDRIAKRRKRISKGFCVMPTLDQRKRFIS